MRFLSFLFAASQVLCVAALLVIWVLPVQAQIVNFKPLESGEFSEEEERLFILRGLEVSGHYAIRMGKNKSPELTDEQNATGFAQDFNLGLKSTFHRDVAMHLGLGTAEKTFTSDEFRAGGEDQRGGLNDAQSLSLDVGEAYLEYRFNPRSALLLGKHEFSIGDRRGKIFRAVAPGFTFDCRIGTWCMPFGAAKIGPSSADWVLHYAFDFRVWDEPLERFRNRLEIEVFHILYRESRVPLANNRGPGFLNPDPEKRNTVGSTDQLTDSTATGCGPGGCPIYYDVDGQDFFGFNFEWESGPFLFHLDFVTNKGSRRLRRYRTGTPLRLGVAERPTFPVQVSGFVHETEVTYRWPRWSLGLRVMNASGDTALPLSNKEALAEQVSGFHEITPGNYEGARLYFNGADTTVEAGGGLGHSVSNTRLIGLFWRFSDKAGSKFEYDAGLYRLTRVRPVFDDQDQLQDTIGVELDTRFTWYLHEAVKVQIEVNVLEAQGAFALDDFTRPRTPQKQLRQGFLRLVYEF